MGGASGRDNSPPRFAQRSGYNLFLLRFTGHWHEANRQHGASLQLAVLFFEKIKFLITETAHRNNHATALFQLVDERLWDVIRSTSHRDCIEGRILRPASVTVANSHMHVLVPEKIGRA